MVSMEGAEYYLSLPLSVRYPQADARLAIEKNVVVSDEVVTFGAEGLGDLNDHIVDFLY